MRKLHFILHILLISNTACSQHIPFSGNSTPTWEQAIQTFEAFSTQYECAKLVEHGKTDIGKPLHVLVINTDKVFDPSQFDEKKTVLLINNAIHPGEPDGVDACISLCSEILNTKNPLHYLLDSVIICIIPIYNIDGAHIRNGYSRANQNGPNSYGFRGNAKNLDLNRDFIKCDSKNAKSFTSIFQKYDPAIFIDTHVSNGADYQYTMTLISTQANKLGSHQAKFLKESIEPYLYHSMESKEFPMTPYVNHMGMTPESGIADFLETPRFGSGYAALFQCIGFISETHMLKPYDLRVESTYSFIVSMLEFIYSNNSKIIDERNRARDYWKKQTEYSFGFELDTSKAETFNFKGYEAITENSVVGSGQRLRYDRNQPFQRPIPFYRSYIAKDTVRIPTHYIVPQAWEDVIERLKLNQIEYTTLENDTVMEVSGYYLQDEKTSDQAYEGHYLHQSVGVIEERMNILLFKGDLLIPTQQNGIRYIVETLEPKSKDSFYSWNFFDSVLQQKEWFSDYVFEEKAAEILQNNPALKMEFEKELPQLEQHWEQLYWIYRHSEHFERSAFRYPIYKLYAQ